MTSLSRPKVSHERLLPSLVPATTQAAGEARGMAGPQRRCRPALALTFWKRERAMICRSAR
jgi:hypothetical protein